MTKTTMRKKVEYAAKANSSYTFFFTVSSFVLSYFVSNIFNKYQPGFMITVLGYALLLYFLLDFIKQLYSPWQSLVLYFFGATLLPFSFAILISGNLARIGVTVFILSHLVSLVLEGVYEYGVKRVAPSSLLRRIYAIDSGIDQRLLKIHGRQHDLNTLSGFLIASGAIVVYYSLVLIWVFLLPK